MGIVTKQLINKYYNNYNSQELVFSKNITKLLGLNTKHIYIKSTDLQRPCIIYSSSMVEAKIIVSLNDKLKQKVMADNNINLRIAMKNEDKKNDLLFFYIKSKPTAISEYKKDQNLYFITLSFNTKPSEILIKSLGEIFEANENSVNRKDERIIIDKESMIKLNLTSHLAKAQIDMIPRQCILRDISFSGVKVLLSGNSKFLNNKIVKLNFSHNDYGVITLLGKIVRSEHMANRKDIASLGIALDIKHIPEEYKLVINDYLKSKKNNTTIE